MNDKLNTLLADDASTLQSIYWMAAEAKVQLPPIPELYLDRFIELGSGTCFTTEMDLIDCLGTSALEARLKSGSWPVTGMAFQLVENGRWTYWNYILAGRAHLIQVNLSAPLSTRTDVNPLGPISKANRQLDSFLSDEIVLSRYLATGPLTSGEVTRVIRLRNTAGSFPTERHFLWTEDGGLRPQPSPTPIFTEDQPQAAAEKADETYIVFHP